VTLPLLLATGAAEALTPPTLSARTDWGNSDTALSRANKIYFTD
jgi:hypothetical protein